jgi:hypothetical protein
MKLDKHSMIALFMLLDINRTTERTILNAVETESEEGARLWSDLFNEAHKKQPGAKALELFEQLALLYDKSNSELGQKIRDARALFASDWNLPLT